MINNGISIPVFLGEGGCLVEEFAQIGGRQCRVIREGDKICSPIDRQGPLSGEEVLKDDRGVSTLDLSNKVTPVAQEHPSKSLDNATKKTWHYPKT